jgi:TolB protein
MYFLHTDGRTDDFPIGPGGFSAPGWEGDSLLYSVVRDDGNLLILATTDGEETREILAYPDEVATALSPDGTTVAYVDIRAGAAQPALGPLIADTVDGPVEVTPEVTAFFWGGDGTLLLYLAPDRTSEDLLLRWGVWDGTTTTTFEGFVPSATLVARYLPFFSQYSNSHSFLSPDSSSFVFAGEVGGESGVWIQKIEEGVPAQRLTDGVVATWAP